MKQLLNTLFVLTEDTWLSTEDENIVVCMADGSEKKIPFINIENIIYFGWKGASPALLGACAERGIGFCFISPFGKFLARVCGISHGNVLLRKAQYRLSDDEHTCCTLAKYFITGKICNARATLMRALRDHPLSVNKDKFTEIIRTLRTCLNDIVNAQNTDELRGLEGNAAKLYFSAFDDMILADKKTFRMEERTRRPPTDPINAMLSFAYTILSHDCASALEAVGLDAYVGFLHRDRPGRMSLALDLMEELRSVYADRFVLTLVNNRIVSSKHFRKMETGAVLLNDEGRKIVLQQWQERKREKIEHPFLHEKISWGLVSYVQALLLAKYIRQDLDGYPAFIWK